MEYEKEKEMLGYIVELARAKKIKNFDQPLNNWDVSKVTDMRRMFRGASSFDQDISMWDVSKVKDYEGIFDDCPIKLRNMPKKFRKYYENDISRY